MTMRGTIALTIAAALIGFAVGDGQFTLAISGDHQPTKAPPESERSVVSAVSMTPVREDARSTGTDAPASAGSAKLPSKWFRDRAEAEAAAEACDGLVYEFHSSPNCPPCKRLKDYVETDRFAALHREYRLVLLFTSGDQPAPRSYVSAPGKTKNPGLVGFGGAESYERWLSRRVGQVREN